jgi:NADH-quinone oxidoreductase subunit M
MLLAIMAMYWDAGTTEIPALCARLSAGPADLGLARVLRLFAGEAADVAGPYLAARRARRGADRRVGDPRRHPVEDGRLRFLALFAADVSRRPSHDLPRSSSRSPSSRVYTSLVALVQEDMKKLIAYSSVAHMGFVTMGSSPRPRRGCGGIFQMISHGIVSAALFLCVGVVYDRMHTREIAAYGGLVNRMPLYAAAFLVFTLANVGCRAPRASSASSSRSSAPSG